MTNLLPAHLQRQSPRSAPTATLVAGLRYEARVGAWLEECYNFHPQVGFETSDGQRFYPDGLLFDEDYGRLCVVEIKSQHSNEGVAQLLRYQSWLSGWFGRPVQAAMITQVYRPELHGSLVPNIDCITRLREPVLGVVAMAARNLPRLRGVGRGVGVVRGAVETAVRSGGGVGDGAYRGGRAAILVAPSGTA